MALICVLSVSALFNVEPVSKSLDSISASALTVKNAQKHLKKKQMGQVFGPSRQDIEREQRVKSKVKEITQLLDQFIEQGGL